MNADGRRSSSSSSCSVPLVIVAGTLVGLFALGALFDLLENPGDARGRIEGLFRRPPAPARPTGQGPLLPGLLAALADATWGAVVARSD